MPLLREEKEDVIKSQTLTETEPENAENDDTSYSNQPPPLHTWNKEKSSFYSSSDSDSGIYSS